MPKIVGDVPPFIGTHDNLTIYLMNGEYIIRTKSSLTGKRVTRDPAFAKTMKYAGWLKQGARIASRIYRQLPDDKRVYKRYRELTGKAIHLLKEGFDAGDVIIMLEAVYLHQSVENAAGNCTNRYSDDYSGINISKVVYPSQAVGIAAAKDTDGYSDDCSGINISKVVYPSQAVGIAAAKDTDGYSADCNKYCNEYCNEYSRAYTGKSSGKRVDCNREQTRSYVSKCGGSTACKLNSKHCCECGCRRVKSNDKCNSKRSGKCAKENENQYEYAHEYILPYYCFGDRPQRAVQVGITGLSYLKYADATDRGLIELLKPIRPLMLNSKVLQRTTASDPTCNRELEGQR